MKINFFNVPNKITLMRIFFIPLFVFFMLSKIMYSVYIAALIFLILSASDYLDGYFARKKKQITDVGKIIDPMADKLLIGSALILLIGKGVPMWIAFAIIFREVIITLLRIYVLTKGTVIPASGLGKWKTVAQTASVLFALLNFPFTYALLILAAMLTWVSGIDYIIKVKKITRNEIINIPNAITFLRFVLIPVFVFLAFKSESTWLFIVFAVIAATDKLDGLSARLTNQMTKFGSAFDSFTDWTFIITAFFTFVAKGRIDMIWALTLSVPGIISALSKMIYAKKEKIVPVTSIAKISVGLIYITLLSIMIDFQYKEVLMISTILLSYFSMIVYLVKVFGIFYKE